VHTIILGTFIIGAATVGLGMVPWFWIYLAMMLICGVSLPMFNTPATVLLQESVKPDYLGRVFGVLSMISSLAWPLGMIIFGPVADVVPIETLLIGTGIGIMILGFSLLASKTLVKAGHASNQAKAGEQTE